MLPAVSVGVHRSSTEAFKQAAEIVLEFIRILPYAFGTYAVTLFRLASRLEGGHQVSACVFAVRARSVFGLVPVVVCFFHRGGYLNFEGSTCSRRPGRK